MEKLECFHVHQTCLKVLQRLQVLKSTILELIYSFIYLSCLLFSRNKIAEQKCEIKVYKSDLKIVRITELKV